MSNLLLHRGWKRFITLCQSVKTDADWEAFFELFLTDEEKQNMATRVMIIEALLEKNLSQRDIAKQLNVSIAKITRGSNILKRLKPAMLKRLFHDKIIIE